MSRLQALRVLHVAETLLGGISSYLAELLPDQLRRYGDDRVALLAPADQIAGLPALPGLRVTGYRRGGRNPLALLSLLLCVRRCMRDLKPDLVHAHSSFAGALARLAGLGLRRRPRIVYCAHGWSFLREVAPIKNWLSRTAERCLAPLGDAIINVSEAEQEAALAAGLPREQCVVIRNGIAAHPVPCGGLGSQAQDQDQASSESPLRLLFIGRHDRQKGLDLLLQEFRDLPSEQYRLFLIGSAVLDRKDARASPLPPGVCALGWLSRAQIDEWLQRADAVVIPSRWEGFGLVALEAMRAGVAVIASNRGALPEVVGNAGRVYPLEERGGLARVLRGLDRAALRAMGEIGRIRQRQEFDSVRMCQEVHHLYERVAPQITFSPRPMP